MRLTLRTLLAYMDKTLDASDSVALAKKVNYSSFATTIIERIKTADDCLANTISFRQFDGIDNPNLIGEYLDSVLNSADVQNIERLCIESFQHLIEVAVIHHVLTLVLGQRAVVPNILRQRSHGLDPSRSFDDAVYDAIFPVVPSDYSGSQSSGSISTIGDKQVAPFRQGDSGIWDAHKRFNFSDFDEANSLDNLTIGPDRLMRRGLMELAAKKSSYKMILCRWMFFLMLILVLFLLFSGLQI
jgi:hypothetical protein